MALPAVLLVLVLSYLPMSGLILAFKNYRFDRGYSAVTGMAWRTSVTCFHREQDG